MSYDVSLVDDGKTVSFDRPHNLRGGTYAVGGTNEAELNVTYNYGRHIRAALHPEGLKWLDGKTVRDTLPQLRLAAANLRGEPSDNYWEASPGNARKALIDLIMLAESAPEAKWRVT